MAGIEEKESSRYSGTICSGIITGTVRELICSVKRERDRERT